VNAREIADGVRSGRLRAVDVVEASLARCEALQGPTNAFRHIDRASAIAAAAAVDAVVAAGGDPGPLAGVPIAVKDNLHVAGWPSSAGSRMLDGYVAPAHATAVARLVAAGAVVVATTNMDEFGMGSASAFCAFGAVSHPEDAGRVPGGSSGGSAVAVAAGAVPLALGSDTGGSIRQPAAFCGIAGLKPTWGRVSRRGLVAYASSLDTVGPLARDVDDLALALSVIAGPDPLDATSADAAPVPALDLAQVRVGRLGRAFGEGLQAGVGEAVDAALSALAGRVAAVVDVDVPSSELAVDAYYVIAPAEAASNLARYDGVRYGHRVGGRTVAETHTNTRATGFGPEVKRRILLGTYVASAGYADRWFHAAERVRAAITAELEAVLATVDVIVLPTAPTVAWRHGDHGDGLSAWLADQTTIPASLAGLPAVSVPCGRVDGLPVGVQVIGRRFEEATCLAVASALAGGVGRG